VEGGEGVLVGDSDGMWWGGGDCKLVGRVNCAVGGCYIVGEKYFEDFGVGEHVDVELMY